MSKQSAADRLREFARTDEQDSGVGVAPYRRGVVDHQLWKPKSSAHHSLKQEKQAKLTLKHVSSQLMAAIHLSNAALTGKMDEIQMDIGLIRQEMHSIRDRMAEAENRISLLEDTLSPMPKKVSLVEKPIAIWYQKTDDFENRHAPQ